MRGSMMDLRDAIKFFLARHPVVYRKYLESRRGLHVPLELFDKLVFLSLVHDGDVVIEVGAHRGEYTVLLSNIVGPSGHVHAFEPVSSNMKALVETVRRKQHFRNTTLHECAVSDESGPAVMQLPVESSKMGALRRHENCGAWVGDVATENVRMTTLDDFMAAHNLKKVNLVKLDVEGAELLALKGASDLLSAHQPILYLEFHRIFAGSFNYDSAELADFLCTLGYSHFRFFSAEHGLVRLDSRCTELAQERLGVPECYGNLLCTVPSKHGRPFADTK